jgi:hypothetical protein
MKYAIRLLWPALASAALVASPASAAFGEVAASFPAPAPKPIALTWADGSLYCFCQSPPYLLWEINPANGNVLGSFRFAKTGADTAGLAHDGKYFWAGNTETDYIYRFEWGGSVASSFKVNWDFGQGLTWSGFHLWGAAIGTKWSHGYYQMRLDGKVIRSFTSFYELFDLAWDGANLWAAEYDDMSESYRIVGFDAVKGTLVGSFATPADEPWGAAYDGRYVWLSTWADGGRLWKVDIRGVGVTPQSLGRVKALFL